MDCSSSYSVVRTSGVLFFNIIGNLAGILGKSPSASRLAAATPGSNATKAFCIFVSRPFCLFLAPRIETYTAEHQPSEVVGTAKIDPQWRGLCRQPRCRRVSPSNEAAPIERAV